MEGADDSDAFHHSSWRSMDYYTAWWCSRCECYHDGENPCPQKRTELEYDSDRYSDFVEKMDEMLKILKKIEKKVKS